MAANDVLEYKVVSVAAHDGCADLNQASKDGWTLVAAAGVHQVNGTSGVLMSRPVK